MLYLPILSGCSEAGPASREEESVATVLLVEDEPSVRKVLRHMLNKSGYAVLEAGSAAEALATAAGYEGTIDVLLTDVVMPQSSCARMVERLRAERPELKVLYISGYSEDILDRYGVDQAEPNFLRKPFTAEALARRIEQLLEGRGRVRGAGAGPKV